LALTKSSILYLQGNGADRALADHWFGSGQVRTDPGYAESVAIGGSEGDLFDVRYQRSEGNWVVMRSRPVLQPTN
jgi:hypothetical protein